jgi:hypothetical protein
MRINEILLESSNSNYHGIPALETLYEAGWESQPIKHYSGKEQGEIHSAEELPYDPKNQKDILHYTGNGASKWNDFLHRHYRGRAKTAEIEKYGKRVSGVDRELARNTLKKDYTLYTGLPESPIEAFKLYNQPTDRPLTVHLPAYTSTTTEWSIAAAFAISQASWDPIDRSGHKVLDSMGKKIKNSQKKNKRIREFDILRIFVPAGTTGASVADLSQNSEREVLLPRGLDIVISPKPHQVEYRGDHFYVWNAKVVGHTPQPVVFDQNT